MNCNKVRRYFYAFTDNELNVDKNIEVLEHLDMCYECSQYMEKERRLHAKIRETVSKVKAPDYLERLILEKTEETPGFFVLFKKSLSFRNPIAPLAAIGAVVILIVSIFVIPTYVKKSSIPYFAELTYHNYLMQEPELEIRSRDVKTVENYLRKQSKSEVLLPKVKDGVFLIGASLSDLDGTKVSQVYYMYEDIPISVMIICKTSSASGQNKRVEFSGMEEVSIGEQGVYYKKDSSCGHCQIIGWKAAGNQYVMVSMLHSNEMMRILTKA